LSTSVCRDCCPRFDPTIDTRIEEIERKAASREDLVVERADVELLRRHARRRRVEITARGQYAAGEGIIGFSWALFAARCRAQVVSQWKVDSAATSVLMRNFHRNVRNDPTRAASALQKTIVAMLKTKEYRHRFYWAGFVVLGDAL
jgi:RNA 3'-terminal phosphate cyclase